MRSDAEIQHPYDRSSRGYKASTPSIALIGAYCEQQWTAGE